MIDSTVGDPLCSPAPTSLGGAARRVEGALSEAEVMELTGLLGRLPEDIAVGCPGNGDGIPRVGDSL